MKQTKYILLGGITLLGLVGFGTKTFADEIDHTVTSSDTLSSLSLEYYGDLNHINQIAADNNLANPDLIFDGTTLKIYRGDDASEPVAEVNTQDNSQTDATPASDNSQADTSSHSGRTLTMEATAYSSDPADTLGGGTVTATGQNLLENPMAVAVDPNVIPLGTRLYVEGYGEAVASDTGGAIKGNIIDVHFPTYDQTIQWGRRTVQVTILD